MDALVLALKVLLLGGCFGIGLFSALALFRLAKASSSTPGTTNSWSRVRLDPLRHIYELRSFPCRIDQSKPLSSMVAIYDVTGLVTIVEDMAVIEMVRGEISMPALRDFEEALKSKGVKYMKWERHRPDGSVKYVKRRIK